MKARTIRRIAGMAGLALLLGCGKTEVQQKPVQDLPWVVPKGFVAPLGFDAYRTNSMPPEEMHTIIPLIAQMRWDKECYLFLAKTDDTARGKIVIGRDISFSNAVLFSPRTVGYLVSEKVKTGVEFRTSSDSKFLDLGENGMFHVAYNPSKVSSGQWANYVRISSEHGGGSIGYFGSYEDGKKGLVSKVILGEGRDGEEIELGSKGTEELQIELTKERNNLIKLLVEANRNTRSFERQ